MSGDLRVPTPHQAAVKSQACVLPHSSGNPRRHLLLARVLRQQNNFTLPRLSLGTPTQQEAYGTPAITSTQGGCAFCLALPNRPAWVASPRVPPKVLGRSRRLAGKLQGAPTTPQPGAPTSPRTPSLPPQRAIGLPALPESSLQTVVAPGPGPSFLGCHHFPSGHRARICQVSSKPFLLPRAESQKAPITALAHRGPPGPPSQPLLLLLP